MFHENVWKNNDHINENDFIDARLWEMFAARILIIKIMQHVNQSYPQFS